MRARGALAVIGATLALSGCATTSSTVGADVCSEYRALRCMTAVECSMDHQRGCQVCACSPASDGRGLPNAVPPDRRVPER